MIEHESSNLAIWPSRSVSVASAPPRSSTPSLVESASGDVQQLVKLTTGSVMAEEFHVQRGAEAAFTALEAPRAQASAGDPIGGLLSHSSLEEPACCFA